MRSASSASNVNGGVVAAAGTNNEILNQMQSQRSVLSSFARSSLGGDGRGTILPVVKHVDKVLMRKLATKVASPANRAMRTSDVDDATRIILRAWSSARSRGGATGLGDDGIVLAFRLREAPLRTLRRCMRLFICAGGGPGAMRGDGTNGWISVLDDESGVDSRSLSPKWHNVVYPGLSSRLGLDYYEFGRYYNHIPMRSNRLKTTVKGPFSCHCEFQLWELGVEIRSFVDQANEIYEIERQAHRKREKRMSKLESREYPEEERRVGFKDEEERNTMIRFLNRDGSVLLTEEGRRDVVTNILAQSFNDTHLQNDVVSDLVVDALLCNIENDILSFSNSECDDDCDGFICDTERLIAATAVICHRVLERRIKHPSAMLLSLVERPWLRHLCFDSILAYLLWDCIPIFERRGHHSIAVSILQTILLGQEMRNISDGSIESSESSLCLAGMKSKPYVECLLPRRNRGKACERLLIDMAHAGRRDKILFERKLEEKRKTKKGRKSSVANKKADQLPLKSICKALLSDTESIPFCSLRNLARRSSAPIPQTKERCALSIRPSGDDWSPKTDSAVANAIMSDSGDAGVGKRCAFVGWEMHDHLDEMEKHRSLNVEELAMEEYHFGRLPCDQGNEEEVKGQWVGWHNEGGHARALFRILCLHHLMECCPQDALGIDEHTTVILTPYQSSPHDLHVGCFKTLSGFQVRGFYERRRRAIESFLSDLMQLDACGIGNKVYESVKQRWERHKSDQSRLKDSRLLKDVTELKTLSLIGQALGPVALTRIFRALCFDYRHWSGGLPDLFLVRARYEYASPSGANSVPFVQLADWIGEGFSNEKNDSYIHKNHISMLTDRDDEFLGQPKNADGLSSQNLSSARKKQGAPYVQLPLFPEKLEFVHDGKSVKAECMFVEVKSANDRLSERQEDWLSILEPDARVCKFTNSASGKKSNFTENLS
ncbi:hypothetical protein ACHAXA_003804 [Cyclostephanos tholiformis]|uniref:Fanconi-associated nuclease n=1 Tax=Cyclostephanos tholiformis TaxID=382380 RepID=A0ABD3RWG1_9STRA